MKIMESLQNTARLPLMTLEQIRFIAENYAHLFVCLKYTRFTDTITEI